MPVFYRQGILHIGDSKCAQALPNLMAGCPSPVYVYDLDGMLTTLRELKNAFSDKVNIHYAMKANHHPRILQAFAHNGYGVDVVSGGEVQWALQNGFTADKIIFSGVGKTVPEIELAIHSGIAQLNVESLPELVRIGQVARRLGKKASVAFRMNPDVDPQTHPYITTGFRDNKFGIDMACAGELFAILNQFKSELIPCGLTMHVGSQILKTDVLLEAIEKLIPLHQEFVRCGFKLNTFDVGGGIGIDYQRGEMPSAQVKDYGARVRALLDPLNVQVLCEPGRLITAIHGALITEIQYLKETPHKNFVIVDTGMHHLLRPSLYQAFHRILPLVQRLGASKTYDVVGPICESSDVIGRDRELNVQSGDFLAIAEAGAYGMTMASTYNMHAMPNEVVVFQGQIQRN